MRTTTSGHNGEIIALLNDPASKSDSFFCVGKDGFLSHWNNNQGNTYQLTDKLNLRLSIQQNQRLQFMKLMGILKMLLLSGIVRN